MILLLRQVGQDSFGVNTRANFERHGVDVSHLLIAEDASVSSGIAPITVDENGENSIVVIGGANDFLTCREVEAAEAVIALTNILLVQLEIPLECSVAAMRLAKRHSTTVLLNTAPAQSLSDEVLSLCDIIVPNQGELGLITGLPTTCMSEVQEAATQLLARVPGCQSIICTLGSQGCLYIPQPSQGPPVHVPVPAERREIKVVDTVGAGDSFVGSLAFFLASGHEMMAALQKANFVASISVTRPGTQTSYPTRSELPTNMIE